MLYVRPLRFIYFTTGGLCLLILFTYFTQLPTQLPPGNHPLVLYIWVYFCFVFLDPMYKEDHMVFVFLCLTYFT